MAGDVSMDTPDVDTHPLEDYHANRREIGEAWIAAERATRELDPPRAWIFHGVSLVDHSMESTSAGAVDRRALEADPADTWGPDWVASATWEGHCEYDDCDHDEAFRIGIGDTPTAALRAFVETPS